MGPKRLRGMAFLVFKPSIHWHRASGVLMLFGPCRPCVQWRGLNENYATMGLVPIEP